MRAILRLESLENREVPAATELVVNGGFEQPSNAPQGGFLTFHGGSTFRGWSVGGDSVDIHDHGHTEAAAGKQSLDLSGNAPGVISQTLTTIPGKKYVLSFWAAGHVYHPYGGAAKAEVRWGGATIATLQREASTDIHLMNWEREEFVVTATSDRTVLQFRSLSPNGGIILDDVSVVVNTPPPAPSVATDPRRLRWSSNPTPSPPTAPLKGNNGYADKDDQYQEIIPNRVVHLEHKRTATLKGKLDDPRDTDMVAFSALEGQTVTLTITRSDNDPKRKFLMNRDIRALDPNNQFHINYHQGGKLTNGGKTETITFTVGRTTSFAIALWVAGNSPNLQTGTDTAKANSKVGLGGYTIKLDASDPPIVTGDLTAYRLKPEGTVNAWYLDSSRIVPEAVEATQGVGIRINGDNDDNDPANTPDYAQGGSKGAVLYENDLVRMDIRVPLAQSGGLEYTLRSDNSNLTIWQQAAKVRLVPIGERGWLPLADRTTEGKVWVEWSGPNHGSGNISLVARNMATGEEWELNRIHFYTFQSRIVLFSGETNLGGREVFAPEINGMRYLGDDLLSRGYDIAYYTPRDQRASTRPLTDLIEAANGYNLHDVAFFGHSHGGGAVYQLAEAVFSTSAATWPTGFKIRLTGYVDAIEQDGFLGGNLDTDSEIRRPFSLYHVNYYQTTPYLYFLKGAPTVLNPAEPIPSVANYNVTDPLYDHSTIASRKDVRDGLLGFTELLLPTR